MIWEDVPRSGSEIIAAGCTVVEVWCKMLRGALGE